MKKQSQFYLDLEGSSGNSHFRAMTALYFFQHLVQLGTFQHYFSLTNEYFQNKCVYHLFVRFYLRFRAFLAILSDVIFSCPKTAQHFTLPKMSIMSVYRHLFILIDKQLFLYWCPFQYTLICLPIWPQSIFFSECLKSCPIVMSDFHTRKVVLLDALEPIGIQLGVQNTCIGDVINFCVLYLLHNRHKMSTKE